MMNKLYSKKAFTNVPPGIHLDLSCRYNTIQEITLLEKDLAMKKLLE